MSFTLSGSTITQSGTDTDLGGLAAIAGVSTFIWQRPYGTATHTIYKVGTLKLRINGTCTVSPESEMIVSDAVDICIEVSGTGTFIIDNRIIKNGNTTYGTDIAIIATHVDKNSSGMAGESNSIVRVLRNTGKFSWYGGKIIGSKPLGFGTPDDQSNSPVITIEHGIYTTHGAFHEFPCMIRSYSTNVAVDTFTFEHGGAWLQVAPSTKPMQHFHFNHAYGFTASGYMDKSIVHQIRDYNSDHALQDFCFWKNLKFEAINNKEGSNVRIVGLASDDSDNTGCVAICKKIESEIKDSDGTLVDDVIVHFHDENNGKRKNFDFGDASVNEDFTQSRAYIFTTKNGAIGTEKILLAAGVRKTGGVQGKNNSGVNEIDYRGKNGDSSDIFTCQLFGYLYVSQKFDQNLKGTGTHTVKRVVQKDTAITQSNRATVQGYTSIDTSYQLYDAVKDYAVTNFETYDGKSIVERDNDTITTDYNVVLDATAAKVLDINETNKTITIKTQKFKGNIILPSIKTVVLQNNATLAKGSIIIDSTGDSYIVWDAKSYSVYPSLLDAKAGTNKIGDSSSDGIFRFVFVGNVIPQNKAVTLTDGSVYHQMTLVKGNNTVIIDTLFYLQNIQTLAKHTNKEISKIIDTQGRQHTERSLLHKKIVFDAALTSSNTVDYTVVLGSRSGDEFTFDTHTKKIQIDISVQNNAIIDHVFIGTLQLVGSGYVQGWEISSSAYKGNSEYFLFNASNGSVALHANNNEFSGFTASGYTYFTKESNTGYTRIRIEMKVNRIVGSPAFKIGEVKISSHADITEITGRLQQVSVAQVQGVDVVNVDDFKADTTAILSELKHTGNISGGGAKNIKTIVTELQTDTTQLKAALAQLQKEITDEATATTLAHTVKDISTIINDTKIVIGNNTYFKADVHAVVGAVVSALSDFAGLTTAQQTQLADILTATKKQATTNDIVAVLNAMKS